MHVRQHRALNVDSCADTPYCRMTPDSQIYKVARGTASSQSRNRQQLLRHTCITEPVSCGSCRTLIPVVSRSARATRARMIGRCASSLEDTRKVRSRCCSAERSEGRIGSPQMLFTARRAASAVPSVAEDRWMMQTSARSVAVTCIAQH